MARKRRTSKKLGDFYLIILAIVIFIIIKIIEAIKAVPWQFWVGAFCVLFLFSHTVTKKPPATQKSQQLQPHLIQLSTRHQSIESRRGQLSRHQRPPVLRML